MEQQQQPLSSSSSASSSSSSSSSSIDIRAVLSSNLSLIDGALSKWVPREASESVVLEIFGVQRHDCDVPSLNTALFGPIWDLLDRGGKRWRSTLLLLVAEALGTKPTSVIDFVVITEIIHNGSLIIDDIEDESEFRRGKACLHKLVGVDVAVNAGNFMYFLPLRVLQRMNLPADLLLKCYKYYTDDMLNLHLGQGLDICWHSTQLAKADPTREPTVSNYLQMCANKTGGLARMSAKISALISGGTEEQIEAFGRFAESVGVAFQIQDDLLNINSSALADTKGQVGEDIHEGKRSLMVIHCFNNAPEIEVARLKEILSMKTSDQKLIDEAIQIIKKNKSIEFAEATAKGLISSAWNEIDSLVPQNEGKAKLKALVDFLIDRDI